MVCLAELGKHCSMTYFFLTLNSFHITSPDSQFAPPLLIFRNEFSKQEIYLIDRKLFKGNGFQSNVIHDFKIYMEPTNTF